MALRPARYVPALFALPVLAGVALAQPRPPDAPVGPVLSSVGSLAASLVVSAVIGLLVVGLAPDYARTIVGRVRARPGQSVLYGLASFVAAFVATVALAITIVGLVVAVPGAIAFGLLVAAGSVLGWTALFASVLGGERSLVAPMLAGVLASVAVGLVPLLGGLVNLVVSATGFGAMSAQYLASR